MRGTTSGPRRSIVALLSLVLAFLGCANTEGLLSLQGQSGAVAWEVSDIRQTTLEHGLAMRWDYVLTLRNTGANDLTFDKVTRNTMASDVYGGMSSNPLSQRLPSGKEWRISNNSYTHGCPSCSVSSAEHVLHVGITRILEYTGHDDQGRPVTVTVRIPLNSGVGVRTGAQ